MDPIRATIEDSVAVAKIVRVQQMRGHKKPSRTLRELALERAKQIEDFGDGPLMPLATSANNTTPQTPATSAA